VENRDDSILCNPSDVSFVCSRASLADRPNRRSAGRRAGAIDSDHLSRHDAMERVVEPEKGRFVWRDAEIDDLRKRGFMILANLGHPPLWAGRPHAKDQDHWSPTVTPEQLTEKLKRWQTAGR
jgi:hypothetical protein